MDVLKLKPVFKDYIWGGKRLKTDYSFNSDLDKIAEAWVLACHPDGECTVENEEYSGQTLSSVIANHPEYLGENLRFLPYFPLLVKLIDAKDKLSVQVHPSDEYALKNENSYGKTEMWYVLDATQDSYLYYGFKKSISKDEFVLRIKNNTITEVLNPVRVRPGDVFFIEPGTVHAIGAGIMVAEIQQNSNITYRIYDYDRRDAAGNLRPLHIEKAVEVANLDAARVNKSFSDGTLADCKYFTVLRKEINGKDNIKINASSFKSILCIKGTVQIENRSFSAGDCAFIPAGNGSVSVEGCGVYLEIFVK